MYECKCMSISSDEAIQDDAYKAIISKIRKKLYGIVTTDSNSSKNLIECIQLCGAVIGDMGDIGEE